LASEPDRSGYDVVVVGAGLSGLTAGGLLARAGKSVIVVEAEDRPGGHARSIQAGGYSFDPAVHLVMGGNREGSFGAGVVRATMDLLGVSDRCELVSVDPFYQARFPGFTIDVPTGRDAYLAAHAEHFPKDADALTRLAELCARVYAEGVTFPIRPRIRDWITAPARYPKSTRYRNATVQQAVNRYLDDPHLRAVYTTTLVPYVGLPPSMAAFTVWATMMAGYVDEGAFYCRGGFQRLADAFADGLREHGGELVLGRRVDRILTGGGRVSGVRLDDGRAVTAGQVVATVDAREVFLRLIDPVELPGRWMRRIRSTEPSMSACSMYLGTDLDVTAMGARQETFVYRSWDLEEVYRSGRAGRPVGVLVTIPTLVDPDLAPPGRHQVVVGAIAPDRVQDADPAAMTAVMVEAAEEVVPGLSGHIVHATGAGAPPHDASAVPVRRIDTIYGWSLAPGSSGPFRLPQTTPVDGLHLAGQWTQPGHGVWTVVGSGLRAARLVLDRQPAAGLLPFRL
jgi:prolycopene isomerase